LVEAVQRFGPHRCEVAGLELQTTPQVFGPRFFVTSAFMARHLRVGSDEAVLDMGTGSGIQALVAARTARRVVAVDINPEAVRCARGNAARNGLGHVRVLCGDLFEPLGSAERFDLIIFTPPYLEGPLRTPLSHALNDPGKLLIRRFLAEAASHLCPGGRVQLLYSSLADHDEALAQAGDAGWRVRERARLRTLSETYFIDELRRWAERSGR